MILSDKQFKYLILNPLSAKNLLSLILNKGCEDKDSPATVSINNSNTVRPNEKEFISDGTLIYRNIKLWIKYQITKVKNITHRFNNVKAAFKLSDCNVGENHTNKLHKVCLFITWFDLYQTANDKPLEFISYSQDKDCDGNITDECFKSIYLNLAVFKKLSEEKNLDSLSPALQQLGNFFTDPWNYKEENLDPRIKSLYETVTGLNYYFEMKRKHPSTQSSNTSAYSEQIRILTSVLRKEPIEKVFPDLTSDDVQNCVKAIGSSCEHLDVSSNKIRCLIDIRESSEPKDSNEKENKLTGSPSIEKSELTKEESIENEDEGNKLTESSSIEKSELTEEESIENENEENKLAESPSIEKSELTEEESIENENENLFEYQKLMCMSYFNCIEHMLEKKTHQEVMIAFLKIRAPQFDQKMILNDIKKLESALPHKKTTLNNADKNNIKSRLRSRSPSADITKTDNQKEKRKRTLNKENMNSINILIKQKCETRLKEKD